MEGTTIQAALVRAEELRPHFVFVLAQLYPVNQPGNGTITADRFLRLYYDEKAIGGWELDEAAAMIILQVEHYFRRHPARQQGRQQLLWDFATAIAVIGDLEREGLSFPEGLVKASFFGLPIGKSAEWYTAQLKQLCEKRKRQLNDMAAEAMGRNPTQIGSAASDELKDWEIPQDDKTTPAIDYLLALQQQKEMRNLPTTPGLGASDEVRTVSETRESAVDWRVRLNGSLGSALSTRAGCGDFSYLVPDPDAALYPGVIMPGMVGRKVNTALVIDSSSSMNERRLAQAIAETGAIIRTQEGNDGVFVYTCDAAVHSAKEVFHVQQITIIGGGGTDLTPGIEAASRRHPRPDVIVVITDGDTPWPKRGPRGIRVIVVLVGSGSAPNWAYAVIPVPIG